VPYTVNWKRAHYWFCILPATLNNTQNINIMETFLDGGLFEIIIAVAFGYAINFIFLKKYLLVIFSGISILSPAALIFIKSGELYYCLLSFCLINAILLVVLLWKERLWGKSQKLFDIEKFKSKFFNKKALSTE
jgi:hypothetical protein